MRRSVHLTQKTVLKKACMLNPVNNITPPWARYHTPMGKISHPHGMSSRADVSAKQEGCDNTHDEQWWRMEKTKNRRDCSVIDASSSLCVSFSLSPPCRRHNQPENSSESGCCCLACFYFVVRCDNCISDQRDSSTEKTWNDVNISIFYDKYFVTHLGYVMVH